MLEILYNKFTELVFDHLHKIKQMSFFVCLIIIGMYFFGNLLCPVLYAQYKELIGLFLIISFSGILCVILPKTFKFIQEIYKKRMNKRKLEEKIIEALNHLSPEEEWIITTMVENNKNNAESFSIKYNGSLSSLYSKGILCQNNIHETSILDDDLPGTEDPVMYEEFTPIWNLKMPDFVWEAAKSHPDLACPF